MVILAPEPQLFLFLYKTQLFLFLYKNPSKSTENLKNPSKSTEILQNFTKCPGETGQTPPTTTKYHLNTTRRLYNHPRTIKNNQNPSKMVILAPEPLLTCTQPAKVTTHRAHTVWGPHPHTTHTQRELPSRGWPRAKLCGGGVPSHEQLPSEGRSFVKLFESFVKPNSLNPL